DTPRGYKELQMAHPADHSHHIHQASGGAPKTDGCRGHGAGPAKPSVHTAKDPVCGMDVDPHKTPHRAVHGGRPYYFCSAGCRTKFEADPQKYLKPSAAAPAHAGATYTCPMHPEVRQVGPGSCPICGMALEPVEITAEDTGNPELTDMTRRFWIGL